MNIKYRGIKIFIKLVNYKNFKYASFKYGNKILICFDKDISYKDRSKLIHKILKKARE